MRLTFAVVGVEEELEEEKIMGLEVEEEVAEKCTSKSPEKCSSSFPSDLL